MRESVAAFTRRTGLAYAPPEALRAAARPLRPREACPTLFRYPGPEGLRDYLSGGMARLGPRGADLVWLSAGTDPTARAGAEAFGQVALLEPLRLSPCAVPRRRGQYLGVNQPLDRAGGVAWVPPRAAGARAAWDRIATPADARRHLGRRYDEERRAVLDRLHAYLEELSALRRAGAEGPSVPWCAVALRERLRILAGHGVAPRWTVAR